MILDDIVEKKQIRLRKQKEVVSLEEMKEKAFQSEKSFTRPFYEAIKKNGLSIIGEFKKASPSLGEIEKTIPLEDRIALYNQSVDAISCLTEEDYFKGSVKDLKEIKQRTDLPVLRKDFMIDSYQFYEAKAIGADAVLLIAAILDDEKLQEFYELSKKLGLDTLIEVHDEEEMERVLRLKPDIVGVNNRNLKDFTIHLDTTKRLSKMVPKETLLVCESGIKTQDDMKQFKDYKIAACLIGQALMQSKNPKEEVLKLKEVFY